MSESTPNEDDISNVTETQIRLLVVYDVNYMMLALSLFIGVLTISGNGLTLFTLTRFTYLRVKKNYLLASLAFNDLIVGLLAVVTLPVRGRVVATCLNSWAVLIFPTLKDFPIVTSAFHLVVLAADRFIAIVKPLRYEELVTEKRMLQACAGIWIFSFFLSATNLFYLGREVPCDLTKVPIEHLLAMKGTIYITVGTILCCIYGRIFCIAKMAASVYPSGAAVVASGGLPTSGPVQNNKALRVVIPILVVYLVTGGPTMLHLGSVVTLGAPIHGTLNQLSVQLTYLNSSLNIFVYILRNADFRRALRSMFCCAPEQNVIFLGVA